MNQENLLNKIRQKDAKAFTHGGKFHADDIFSSAEKSRNNAVFMRRSGLVMGIILLAKSIEEGPGDDAKGYTDDKQVFHTGKGRSLW